MSEFRPGSFQILPTIIKNLIIINVLIYIAQITVEQSSNPELLNDLFALHTWQSPLFRPWQFITHLFMHGSWAHIFSNMFALWMFGSVLENLWGPKRFLTFYIVCGLGAALLHMIVLAIEFNPLVQDYQVLQQHFTFQNFQEFYLHYRTGFSQEDAQILSAWSENPLNTSIRNNAYEIIQRSYLNSLNQATLGASGAVFGCLAAFGYLFPNTYIYIYFFLPLKAKWFVLIYAGFELVLALQNSAGDNVAHFAHLGGAIFGLALVYFWNKHNRSTFY